MTRWVFVADLNRCVGCQTCTAACKHANATAPGVMWRKVFDIEIGEFPDVRRAFIPTGCHHCAEPPCMHVCPTTATKQREDGIVMMDYDRCIGCRYCYQACPFKVPRFDFETRVTRKCTLCYDRILLSYSKPACVAACPVHALSFGYKHEIILVAKQRVFRKKNARYILGLKEAGGTDMLTILPARPEDLGLVVAPHKVVNHNLDKLRITGAGFMGASALAGLMYMYDVLTREKNKSEHDKPG